MLNVFAVKCSDCVKSWGHSLWFTYAFWRIVCIPHLHASYPDDGHDGDRSKFVMNRMWQTHSTYVHFLMIGWPCIVVYVILVDFQLDAQNSYLFTYNTFIKILYMFRALPCSSSGGIRRNCTYAASGIVTLCRWLFVHRLRKNFLNRCTGQSPAESDDTRGCIYTFTTYTSWRWAG